MIRICVNSLQSIYLCLAEGEFIKEMILQFIELNKYPLVTRLTEHNSPKVYSSPIKLQVIYLILST
jgi:hypothetical protein